ncbi:MAG: TonB-dependent receptor [Acidobacteria bacterium]|nr:TonB-dependent receptor [Acidobacteriota bacterium]
MKNFVRLLVASLLGSLAVLGQADANKAQLSGTVLDPRGAVVAGADIKIKNTQTGLLRELKSSGEGTYRAVQLDPGQYEVTAQSSGFAPTVMQGIVLNVGAAAVINVTLQVQGTTQSVEVSETIINVDLPAPTTLISSTAITNLPINGRRFQDFATLTPTVQLDPARSQLSFAGQRGINSNIMVDGADYNQPFFGGIRGGERSNSVITVPQSSVQEFQAITTGYSAEYGRSSGGILNVISKSGSNSFHGEGFYQNRNSELSKEGPIPISDITRPGQLINVKPAESLQQWGGAIGGPIRRDKLFFFVSYEQQHAVQPRRVFFPSLLNVNPSAGQRPVFDFYKSQEGPFDKTNNAGAGTVKSDYLLKNGSRLTFRYNRSGSEETNAVTVGGAIEAFTQSALSNEGVEKNTVHFGSAQYTAVIRPTLVNDFKFSGSYEERPRLANSNKPGLVASTIGTLGTRNFLPTVQQDKRWQFTDSLTWIAGAHTVKFGADINRLTTGQTFGFDQFGTFSINSSNVSQILDIISGTGTVANKFDSPLVSYSRQIGNLAVDFNATQAAIFAQDSWKVRRTLTVDLGLRWEGQWNPAASSTNAALAGPVDAMLFPNGARTNVGNIKDNLNQIMPRIGFAWSPMKDQRLVVRGHAGIFYAATPLLLYSDPTGNYRNPPNNVRLFLNNTVNGTIYRQFSGAGVNLSSATPDNLPVIPLTAVQQAAAIGLGATPNPFLGAGTTTMATNFENPRSYQLGIGTETRITGPWVLGVQFNYVNAVHLERNRDYNLPIPVVNDASRRPFFGVTNGNRPRPIPTLGQVTVRESSAHSLYRGFTFSNQYRGKKLQAGVFYTAAWNYSDDDNERDSGGQAAMDGFNYAQDYSPSNLDARHTFSSYGVYSLPFGIDVSGVFRVRSGLPLNPRTGADTNFDGASTDRALVSPGVPFGRNSFRNRAVYGDDLRIMKSFQLKENMKVQVSAEFFNVFNIDNVIFFGTTNIYGLGVNAAGATLPVDTRFLVLKSADGRYHTQNQQIGFPFQAQFGIRFFF